MDTYHELDRLSTRDFVRIINDEEILCSIAKEEKDWAAAAYIASNINDEETLEYIALGYYYNGGTTYHQPNQAAIDKIKNPDVLMRIYENTDDMENKVTVAEKLKELNYIEDESLNQAKKIMEDKSLNDKIEQLKLDIAYADSNCNGDCIELAKIYEQQGNTVDAKAYYERAIKEIDIIINSTRGNKQYWMDEKRKIEEHLKKL